MAAMGYPESMQAASQGERDGGRRIRRLGLRRVRQLALLAALAPAAVSCIGQPFEAGPLGAVEVAPSEAIQIRSLQVLTGLGDLGVPSQRGVAMALEDYGPIGGRAVSMGAGLDSLCTEEGGRAAADTVTGDPRVVGVIGTSCSVAASAASPLLSAAGLVMIAPSTTAPSLTSDLLGNAGANSHPGYYRTANNDIYQARAVAQFAYTELGLRSMHAIHDGDPYTSGLTAAFGAAFQELGGSVAVSAVRRGDTDMIPVLTQIAAGGPDGLFFPLFQEEGAHIVRQVRGIVGLEGVTRIGDAATLLLRAIEEVAVADDETLYIDRAKLREALTGVAGFRGIIGVLSCDAFGDCGAGHVQISHHTDSRVTDIAALPVVYRFAP